MNNVTTTQSTLAEAKSIAMLARLGRLTYDEAKIKCAPLLQIVNDRGAEIAKKYNRKYSPIKFSSLVR